MRTNYMSETRLVETVVRAMSTRLPPRWILRDVDRESRIAVRSSPDAIWEIRDPDGRSSDIPRGGHVEPGGTQKWSNVWHPS